MTTGSFIALVFAYITFIGAILGGKIPAKEGEMPNNEARLGLFLTTIIFLLTAILFKSV